MNSVGDLNVKIDAIFIKLISTRLQCYVNFFYIFVHVCCPYSFEILIIENCVHDDSFVEDYTVVFVLVYGK